MYCYRSAFQCCVSLASKSVLDKLDSEWALTPLNAPEYGPLSSGDCSCVWDSIYCVRQR